MGGAVGAAAAAAVLAGHVPPGRLDPDESGYVLAAIAAVGAAVVAGGGGVRDGAGRTSGAVDEGRPRRSHR